MGAGRLIGSIRRADAAEPLCAETKGAVIGLGGVGTLGAAVSGLLGIVFRWVTSGERMMLGSKTATRPEFSGDVSNGSFRTSCDGRITLRLPGVEGADSNRLLICGCKSEVPPVVGPA